MPKLSARLCPTLDGDRAGNNPTPGLAPAIGIDVRDVTRLLGAGGPLRPFRFRRQAHEDRLDVAAGLKAEQGAAIVDQIEFRIAAASD